MILLTVLIVAFAVMIAAMIWLGSHHRAGLMGGLLAGCVSAVIYFSIGGWPQLQAQHSYDMIYQELNHLYELPQLTAEQVATRLNELEQTLAEHPYLWYRMAEIYEKFSWYKQAIAAIQKAQTLAPDNEDIQLKHAYLVALANSGTLDDKTREMVTSLHRKNPQNLAIINVLATDAYKHQQFFKAANLWQSMLSYNTSSRSERSAIKGALQHALASIKPDADELAIKVKVKLGVADMGLDDSTPVFIFAKKDEGMPLAAVRLTVGDLPTEVILSKSQAMRQEVTLEQGQDIIVTARVAKHMSPVAKKGDLEGKAPPVKLSGLHNLTISIDHIID